MARLTRASASRAIGASCVALALVASTALTGCESFELAGVRHVALTYTDDAKQAFNEAMEAYRSHDWEDARTLLAEVKKLFPYSRYARLAELRMADINFEQEKYTDASSGYRQYILSHKNDPDIPYARYRITVALFRDIDDTIFLPPAEERDQATIQDAFREIRSFIRDYPRSRFLKDEAYMYDAVVGRLVRHELYVARYYSRVDDFLATLARVNFALKTYPGSALEAEALVLKGETLMKMKKLTDARLVFQTVVDEYPGAFVPAAQNFLQEIKRIEREPPRPPHPEAERGL